MSTPYLQIKGTNKDIVTSAGSALSLDGSYTTKVWLGVLKSINSKHIYIYIGRVFSTRACSYSHVYIFRFKVYIFSGIRRRTAYHCIKKEEKQAQRAKTNNHTTTHTHNPSGVLHFQNTPVLKAKKTTKTTTTGAAALHHG